MTEPRVLYVRGSADPGGDPAAALERAGLAVVEADGALDAIKRLEGDPVDCVLANADPAGMGLVGFADAVGDVRPSVPVVAVGAIEGHRIDRALGAGVDDYVADVGGVGERVRRAIGDRAVDRALERHRRVKDAVREATNAVGGAGSREGVEDAVYERLSDGPYEFAWIGDYRPGDDAIRLRRPIEGAFAPEELASLIDGGDPGFIERAVAEGTVEVLSGPTETRGAAAATPAPDPGDGSDDAARPELSSAAVPLAHEGEVRGLLVLATTDPAAFDASERALLAEAGESAGRELGRVEELSSRESADRVKRFASLLAHELRNPLGIASTHLQIAREAGEEGSFDRVEAALEEADEAIDGLLAIADGRPVEETAPIDLAEAARAAWDRLESPDAALEIDGSATVEADRDLLVRLLANLFRNAVDHGSTGEASAVPERDAADGGEEEGASLDDPVDGAGVTVRVGPLPGDGFYVADDGPGVPPEERDRVFEWGYSTTDDGTGIGLSLVREVADAHGWSVDLTEGREGGARFEVRGVAFEEA